MNDEQIKQALESAGVEFQYFTHARTNKQVCTTEGSVDFEKIASGIRELIALAQQVKPLVWTDLKHITGKKAETCFGNYYVNKIDALPYRTVYIGEGEFDYADTEAEAISAANEDYRKRVLSCLVNGGV